MLKEQEQIYRLKWYSYSRSGSCRIKFSTTYKKEFVRFAGRSYKKAMKKHDKKYGCSEDFEVIVKGDDFLSPKKPCLDGEESATLKWYEYRKSGPYSTEFRSTCKEEFIKFAGKYYREEVEKHDKEYGCSKDFIISYLWDGPVMYGYEYNCRHGILRSLWGSVKSFLQNWYIRYIGIFVLSGIFTYWIS